MDRGLFRPVAVRLRARLLLGGLALASVLAGGGAGTVFAQDRIDETYTARIREYTTEPFFLTPYVDHLPASATVPTTVEVLGRVVGTPDYLHSTEEIHGYFRAIAEASPRIRLFTIGESEEGREIVMAVIADESTIERLDDYKAMLARLADPRRVTDAEAARLIGEAKPIYWATGAIHSSETGSPEMLMELAYRLAVGESEFIRTIRDNLIVLITPIVEVDGRAKQVDIHMARRRDPDADVPNRLLYWGAYVAHSANRDGMALSLNLTRTVMRTFLEYNPTVLHDLHESAAYLYTSTGRGPYNAWIDPILINEWNRLAYREVQDMTALGVPGVYTFDFYDGWAPNYMFWIANQRNSIGRFYETQAARDGSNYVASFRVDREWHRPNTPLPRVMWSLRNNINLQQSGLLIAMHEVAVNRQEYLGNFYLKSKRSVAKATTEGPAAYVFPASDPRPGQQARLLLLLQRHGIEVHRADRAFTAEGREFGAGSYIVRMDQPFSRTADMLLDLQYYSPADPRPYDDVGWTKGPLYNVETVRVGALAVLGSPMTLLRDTVRAPGGVVAGRGSAAAYLISYNADNNLTTFRFEHPEIRIRAAQEVFTADGRSFGAGSFIIPVADNGRDLADVLERAGERYGFAAYATAAMPPVRTHPVGVPRLAVMHTWLTTQNEGWLRIGFDEYRIPYDYISVHEARDNPRLRDKYDVIVFGPSTADPFALLRGVTGRRPLPWKATDLMPNIGRQTQTDDMRGGLELQGVLNISEFVRQGGVLITLTNSSVLPIHYGMAPGVSIRQAQDLWAPGGVFRVRLTDASSPLTYGYGEELAVHFNGSPILDDGRRRVRGVVDPTDPGSTTERRSGRGGVGDQDIVQGRARDAGQAAIQQRGVGQAAAQQPPRAAGPAQPAATGPRAVFRFADDPAELLISGGLRNGAQLADSPALVDVPHGDGHFIMFSFNPFWRGGTLGSYALVFNALLHHDNLDAGRRQGDVSAEREAP